jgi:AraC-like DNA-binding protein
VSPIPERRRTLLAASQSGAALVGRIENEDRLWRGMKDRYAFVVPRRGWSEYLYRGGTYQQGPGRLQLKEPGEIYRDLRHGGPRSFDVVVIDLEEMDGATTALAGGRKLAFAAPDLDASDPRAGALLALHARLTGAPADGLAEDTALTEAAIALARLGTGATPAGRERSAVRRARAYLLERLAEPVRLDDLADHVGLDKYHLIRAFRAEVGVPPYEFLTHARIHRARELLHRGLSATRVAATLGYYDQSQLHRHFLRLVGLTPGHYARTRARPRPRLPTPPLCFGGHG